MTTQFAEQLIRDFVSESDFGPHMNGTPNYHNLIFYITGHGTPHGPHFKDGVMSWKRFFTAIVESVPNLLATSGGSLDGGKGALDILIILDTCFAGGAINFVKDYQTIGYHIMDACAWKNRDKLSIINMIIWGSCAADQVSRGAATATQMSRFSEQLFAGDNYVIYK